MITLIKFFFLSLINYYCVLILFVIIFVWEFWYDADVHKRLNIGDGFSNNIEYKFPDDILNKFKNKSELHNIGSYIVLNTFLLKI